MARAAHFALFLALALALPSAAHAQPTPDTAATSQASPTYTLEGASLVVTLGGARQTIPLGCSGTVLFLSDAELYVGCDDGTVAMYRVDNAVGLRLERRENVGGSVQRFFVLDDRVWAMVSRVSVEARPLGEGPSPAPSAGAAAGMDLLSPRRAVGSVGTDARRGATTPASVVGPSPRGRVVEYVDGDAVVDLGDNHGAGIGMRVEFWRDSRIDVGHGHVGRVRESLAVGDIVGTAGNRVRVRLGLNEVVPVGANAEVTGLPVSARRAKPPRAAGYWDLDVTLRPFLPIGVSGFGLLADASVGYRFKAPAFIDLALTPGGFAAMSTGSVFGTAAPVIGVALARLAAHYDTHYVSVGLGVGITTFNPNGFFPAFPASQIGLAFTQTARFGTRDGFHVFAENALGMVEGRFEYISTRGQIQIPITREMWLMFRGGGGANGFGFGEAGFRRLLHGRGERGSVFMTFTVGGAVVFQRFSSAAGPSIGVGLEYRL